MKLITLMAAFSAVAFMAACTQSPAPTPTAMAPTFPPTVPATAVPPTPIPTVTALAPTSTSAPSSSTKIPPTGTPSARPAIPANFPLGSFSMSDADGKWTLSFGADSTYEVSQNRKVVVTGIFTVVEDKLTIHDISGTRSCKAAQGDGTYRWTLEGKNLTLKGVSDGCVPRAGALSGSVWSMEQ